jgi:hypothetical protein
MSFMRATLNNFVFLSGVLLLVLTLGIGLFFLLCFGMEFLMDALTPMVGGGMAVGITVAVVLAALLLLLSAVAAYVEGRP